MTEPALLSPSPSPSPQPPPAAPAAASPPTPSSPATTPPISVRPAAPATPAPGPTGPATAPAERPSWLPETFADPTAFRAGYDELAAFKASQDVRRSTLPPSPTDYKAELPPDFKIPEGIKYEFNNTDPLLAQ